MNCSLISYTQKEWAQKTNIVDYAQRQAQSCNYLEKLFDDIEKRTKKHRKDLSELLGYLRIVHRRQYTDLEKVTTIPINDRTSFYFDTLYSAFNLSPQSLPESLHENDLLNILAIQAVSYVRGKDRYRILKDYESKENEVFRSIWTKFYRDATGNAVMVFNFLYNHFDKRKVDEQVNKVIKAEDDLIHTIWRHKNVTTS